MTNPRPNNPYPGPRSFERGETLYGRERETRELLDLLIAERIVWLYSPSGAGKTSLIQAALVPALEEEGFRVHPPLRVNLPIAHVEAGDEAASAGRIPPNRYTLSLLMSLEQGLPQEQQTPLAELAALTLDAYLQRLSAETGEENAAWHGDVLIFDQFEEILTADPTDRAGKLAFFEQVGQALRNRNRWALFAFREEFIAGLDPYLRPIPTRFDKGHTYRLDLLGPDASRQAIQRPARAAGVTFSDAAAAQLVDDLRTASVQQPDGSTNAALGDAIEPVQLQVVCRRLWDQLAPDATAIDLTALQAVGNVNEALGGYYAGAVAEVATKTGIRERAIREWVDTQLITEQGIRSQVLQGKGYSPEGDRGLDNQAIWPLVDAHLVRADQRRGVTWFELAHDRLVTPLRADNAAWRTAHLSALQRQAALWERAGRPKGLLFTGSALVDARQWAADHPGALENYEQDFLAACEEAQSIVEREQGQNRRIRLLNRIVLAVCALVLVLGVAAMRLAAVARTRSLEAQHQTRLAKSGELAANAAYEQTRAIPDPSLALILAEQAVSVARPANDPTSTLPTNVSRALLDAVLHAPPWKLSLPQSQHTGDVFSATYSPKCKTAKGAPREPCGSMILTASKDGTAKLWDATSGDELATLVGHNLAVRMAAFSQDGERVVTASDDGTARIWSLAALRPGAGVAITTSLALEGHEATVRSAHFSPDGRRVVTASNDGSVRVWNTRTGKQEKTLERLFVRMLWADYSPNGNKIVTTDEKGTVKVWGGKSYELLSTLSGHTDSVRSAVFSSDGSRLLTAGDDGAARIWDLATGTFLCQRKVPGFQVTSAVFSPDDRLIAAVTASGSGDKRFKHAIHLWDAQDCQEPELEPERELLTLPQAPKDVIYFGNIWSVAFSPDGTRLVTASTDQTARVWQLAFAGEGRLTGAEEAGVLDNDASYIRDAAFSPDGSTIATSGDDWRVKLWDAATGRETHTLLGHRAWVNSVTFSPDGSQLLTASNDKSARLWDAQTGQPLGQPLLHDDGLFAATFSRDASQIVTAGSDGKVTIWDTATQKPLRSLAAHDGWARSAVFSPDGTRILTAGADKLAKVWDVSAQGSDQPLLTLAGHGAAVFRATFSPDGQRVATASEDGTAKIWDATTGELLETLDGHTAGIMAAVFSPDGTRLVTAGRDKLVKVWDAATFKELLSLTGHQGEVRSAAFNQDGTLLVTAAGDRTARVWQLAPGSLEDLTAYRPVITTHPAATPLQATAFSPDGLTFATAGADQMARVWETRTGKELGAPMVHSDWVNFIAFSPDGAQIVTAGDDGQIMLWDAGTRQNLATWKAHTPRVASVQVSQDGDKIVSAGWGDNTARIWDADTHALQQELKGHTAGVNFAAFSPDGSRIVTASNDRTARLWDAGTGQPLAVLSGHTDRVYTASFAPDGSQVVTASWDGTARLWDSESGKLLQTLRGHSGKVFSAFFSPDGTQILTASEDGTARVWDAATGQERFTPAWFDQSILFAAYSLDGRKVVTVNRYTTDTAAKYSASVWPASVEDLLQAASRLIQRQPPLLTPEERQRFGP